MNRHAQLLAKPRSSAEAYRNTKDATNRKWLILSAFLLSLVVPLTLTGCVGLTGANTPPQNEKLNTASSGALAANATNFNFGQVAVGTQTQQSLTISNI